MSYVKLTDAYGTLTYVAVAHVVSVTCCAEDNDGYLSTVYFADGTFIALLESAEEAAKLIWGAQ